MIALLLGWCHVGWLSLAFGYWAEDLFARVEGGGAMGGRQRSLGTDRVMVLGFLWITALLSVVSLVHAIDLWVNALFVLFGAGLTYRYAADFRALGPAARNRWRRFSRPARMLVVAVGLIASVGTVASGIVDVDARFYHVPAMLWIKKYAVVPGLGNLHGRFAFNSHYFIGSALFSVNLPSINRMVFPVFSLFYALLLIRLLWNTQGAMQRRDTFRFALYSPLFLLFLGHAFAFLNGISTDYIVALLTFHVFLLVLEERPVGTREARWQWIAFALLAGVTYKLSTMFLMVLLPFLLFPLHRRKLAFMVGAGALLMLPFLHRNYMLSGYLVYPLAQIDLFEPDWKVPKERVEIERDYIEAFAKVPEYDLLGGYGEDVALVDFFQREAAGRWHGIWWQQSIADLYKPFLLVNALSVLVLFLAIARREWRIALVLGSTLVYLAIWFRSAPNPRFAFAVIYFNAAVVLAYAVRDWVDRKWVPLRPGFFWALGLAAALLLAYHPRYELDGGGLRWKRNSILAPLPRKYPAMTEVQGVNFTYYMPPRSDLDFNLECYNFPGPCTPYPKAGLMMRGKDFQDGFRILSQ